MSWERQRGKRVVFLKKKKQKKQREITFPKPYSPIPVKHISRTDGPSAGHGPRLPGPTPGGAAPRVPTPHRDQGPRGAGREACGRRARATPRDRLRARGPADRLRPPAFGRLLARSPGTAAAPGRAAGTKRAHRHEVKGAGEQRHVLPSAAKWRPRPPPLPGAPHATGSEPAEAGSGRPNPQPPLGEERRREQSAAPAGTPSGAAQHGGGGARPPASARAGLGRAHGPYKAPRAGSAALLLRRGRGPLGDPMRRGRRAMRAAAWCAPPGLSLWQVRMAAAKAAGVLSLWET
ncbi:uncharacterized protein LOC141931233 [Strix aluco]|uniref:uncharacterized protein LOC141931233 n=1 Tax=Strix aluco TaxID=111821 RepID=UPI003DA3599F